MKIVPWDWHYRVGFDYALRQRILSQAEALPKQLSAILSGEIAAYSSFVSVMALVEAISDCPSDAQLLIDQADSVVPAHLMPSAVDALSTRVKGLGLASRLQKALITLIQHAASTQYVNVNRRLFEPIFGAALPKLLRYEALSSFSRNARPTEVMSPKRQLGALLAINSKFIDRHYHSPPDIHFEIEEREGDGNVFAEYWSADLLGAQSDKLVLYDHAMQSDTDEQNATLVHEVIGHGFFYQLADRLAPPVLDHGALAFVEGWATAVEWELSPTAYVSHYIAQRMRALQLFDETEAAVVEEALAMQYVHAGLNDDQVRAAVGNYFQYPGYGYSYSLGGLWFRALVQQDAFSFYAFATTNPWGNFFSCFELSK